MINTPLRVSILVAIILPFSSQSAFALSTEERLQRLERMADNPVLLQLSQRVSEQQREIQKLQDELDRIGRANRFGIQQANKQYSETDQRISELEAKLKSAGRPAVTVPTSTIQPTTSAPPQAGADRDSDSKEIQVHSATKSEGDEYQAAFALMRASKYDESTQAFETFLASHPKSSLASNASYWAGEGYLIRKEYQKALDAFNVVLERYPSSSKVADSLLRAADSLISLERAEEARVLYQKIIDEYPEARAAKSAKKRLE